MHHPGTHSSGTHCQGISLEFSRKVLQKCRLLVTNFFANSKTGFCENSRKNESKNFFPTLATTISQTWFILKISKNLFILFFKASEGCREAFV
jgi:hypothetical protein